MKISGYSFKCFHISAINKICSAEKLQNRTKEPINRSLVQQDEINTDSEDDEDFLEVMCDDSSSEDEMDVENQENSLASELKSLSEDKLPSLMRQYRELVKQISSQKPSNNTSGETRAATEQQKQQRLEDEQLSTKVHLLSAQPLIFSVPFALHCLDRCIVYLCRDKECTLRCDKSNPTASGTLTI
jgi:hypothetical protein